MSAAQRIKDLAAGWKDSDAEVTVNAADAALLGVPVPDGRQHATLTGKELYAKAKAVRDADDADDLATPNQRDISHGPRPAAPPAPAGTPPADGRKK